jgi:DNA (cytosine-5)-methyltransferase 1
MKGPGVPTAPVISGHDAPSVIEATLPLPSVVRSTVSSCIHTRTPSFVVLASISATWAPDSMARRTLARVLPGRSAHEPMCPITSLTLAAAFAALGETCGSAAADDEARSSRARDRRESMVGLRRGRASFTSYSPAVGVEEARTTTSYRHRRLILGVSSSASHPLLPARTTGPPLATLPDPLCVPGFSANGWVDYADGCTQAERSCSEGEGSVMPKVVSIFCGCGGLDLGFKEAGFELVYACDNDEAAVDCYSRNVDPNAFVRDATSREFHRDIAELDACDVVLGGFPCQGFSKAGPKQEGDERNKLYVEMRRVVARLRPRIFIAENVDGIRQNFGGAYMKCLVADFEQIGYEVDHHILDAAAYGVPQHRRRVFFVGTRGTAGRAFSWPKPTHQASARNGEFKVAERGDPDLFGEPAAGPGNGRRERVRTIGDAIQDLVRLRPEVPDHEVTHAWPKKYEAVFRAIKQGQKLCNVRHADTSVYTWQIPQVFGQVTEQEVLVLETISRHRRHKQYGSIPNGNPLPVEEIERLAGATGLRAEIASLLSKNYLKDMNGRYDLKGAMFCSGLFKRPNWNEPAPTVLTNFHNPRYFLHPLEDRPFSLRECARLQSFPDTFKVTGDGSKVDLVSGYRLIGNAVPPLLSRQFATAVERFLSHQPEAQVAQ